MGQKMFQGKKYRWSIKKFSSNLVILALISVGLFVLGNSVKATNHSNKLVITIHRGDTLWSIAQTIAPDKDPRIIVEELKKQNHLRDVQLTSGDVLKFASLD